MVIQLFDSENNTSTFFKQVANFYCNPIFNVFYHDGKKVYPDVSHVIFTNYDVVDNIKMAKDAGLKVIYRREKYDV